jgi:hypothetical protein
MGFVESLALALTMFSLGSIVGHAAGYGRGRDAAARYRRSSSVGSPE